MRKLTSALVACAAATTLTVAAGAQAASYNFDFEGDGQSVVGVLSTSASSDPGTITGLTGAYNGSTITLLPTGSIGGNDNLFSASQTFSGQYLNLNGFDFSAGGAEYNIYYSSSVSSYRLLSGLGTVSGSFTVSPVSAAVSAAPEPGTWALFLGGVGMLGAAMRIAHARRREHDVKDIATA